MKRVVGRICEILEHDHYMTFASTGNFVVFSPETRLELDKSYLFLNLEKKEEGIYKTHPKFRALRSKDSVEGKIHPKEKQMLETRLKIYLSVAAKSPDVKRR